MINLYVRLLKTEDIFNATNERIGRIFFQFDKNCLYIFLLQTKFQFF